VTELEKTVHLVDSICISRGIPYTIIGGIANIIHGSGRTTQDIDIVIQIEIDELEKVYDIFTREFIPLKENPGNFFKTHFVLPLRHRRYDTRIDISAALSTFERNAIKRSNRHPFGKSEAYFCSPEDLIIFKLVAHREQDIIDVQDIITRLKHSLDKDYLLSTAKLFSDIDRQDIYDEIYSRLKEE